MRSFLRRHLDWSMLRWAIVGVTTFIIDYSLFITLYGPIESVFLANFIAALFATSFNYLLHHSWTFKSEQNHSRSTAKYLLTLLFWWLVGTSILKVLIVSGLDPRLAKFIPVVIVTPFNYFVLNYLVFKKLPLRRSTRRQ
jgi:putative flippase GtrA